VRSPNKGFQLKPDPLDGARGVEIDSPSVPFLVATALCALVASGRRARSLGAISGSEARACSILLGVLCAWIIASGILAFSGSYLSQGALRVLPLLCGFLVPVSIVAAALRVDLVLRSGILGIIESLPLSWLIAVQAIRITALGTIVKYLHGDLPGHFILPVGVPDFAVGLTAIPMAWWDWRSPARARSSLIVWNLAGASIFLPAGILMHVSMPGPVQIFTSGPTTQTLFEFPLALVPTFLVPCFVGLHLACLCRLSTRAV
jgi:hypothetical protein